MNKMFLLYLIFAISEFLSLIAIVKLFIPKKVLSQDLLLKWYICAVAILPMYLLPLYFSFLPLKLQHVIASILLAIYILALIGLYILFNKIKNLLNTHYDNLNDSKSHNTTLQSINNIKSMFISGIIVFIIIIYIDDFLNILFQP